MILIFVFVVIFVVSKSLKNDDENETKEKKIGIYIYMYLFSCAISCGFSFLRSGVFLYFTDAICMYKNFAVFFLFWFCYSYFFLFRTCNYTISLDRQ